MTQPFQAVYEGGILRPLEPLQLTEREVVSVWISRISDGDADSAAQIDQQQRFIERLLVETSQLPLVNSADGLSNRHHDQILYGKPA